MAREMTRAREARIAARAAANDTHDTRRAAKKAEQASIDAEYRAVREQMEAREKAVQAAAGADLISDKVRSHLHDARMKALTGHKNGIGEWRCVYGHRHMSTGECRHGKKSLDGTVGIAENNGNGSTVLAIPLNTVAGQKVQNSLMKHWNQRAS
jgi:hypothetical protein